MEHRIKSIFFCTLLAITGCAPISETDPPTGNIVGTALGGVGGAGIAALFGASKPTIAVAGLAGAGLGYYMSTLRFSSSGIVAGGGKVYAIGDYLIIDIPTDSLFDVNTADFLPGTEPILDSLTSVLHRYNGNNIFISGNTSGSWSERFERRMSECRASQIASYLWAHGISNDLMTSRAETAAGLHSDRFMYVGYGDNFPIANFIHLKGIRANSRIQIVASPPSSTLHWDQKKSHFRKFGNIGDSSANNNTAPADPYKDYAYAFSDDHMTEATTLSANQSSSVSNSVPTMQGSVPAPVTGEYAENGSRYNSATSEPQTSSGVSVPKQAGYKGEG